MNASTLVVVISLTSLASSSAFAQSGWVRGGGGDGWTRGGDAVTSPGLEPAAPRAPGSVVLPYRAVANVLAFSDDGTRALLEERTFGPGGTGSLGYRVVDVTGTSLRVVLSEVAPSPVNQFFEMVDRDACRKSAELLERAIDDDFRDVDVHVSGCSMASRQGWLVKLRTTVAPVLGPSPELEEIQRDVGAGMVWVNERGPLVVVVTGDPSSPLGNNYEVRTFVREDPRIVDRWTLPEERYGR
jgi:hypothetical protein